MISLEEIDEFIRRVIDRIIADGIREVEAVYEEGDHRRVGAIEGFELCRTLTSPEEYERVLTARHRRELKLKSAYYAERKEDEDASLNDYWRHRYATLQLEHVYERLKVLYGSPVVSALAVDQLSRILPEIDSQA